jgi:phage replication O-like protein O
MSTAPNEDGFTMIPNRHLEAVLGGGFSHREQSVVLTIFRKTRGFGKLEDDMSASQIGAVCGIARQHVTSTLNALTARNVITKRQGKFGMIIGVQMDMSKWISAKQLRSLGSPELGLVQSGGQTTNEGSDSPESGLVPNQDTSQIGTGNSPESGQVDSPKSGHTKENLPKENLNRKSTPLPPGGGLVRPKTKRAAIALQTFLDDCTSKGERPLRDYEPLWRYTESVGLETEFVSLAWVEFCRQFRPGGTGDARRYKDWRKAFRNYIEKNYLKLWAIDGNGQYFLTTLGKQAQKHFEAREAA